MADGKKFPGFLWQHKYNGKWATYSKDDVIALNRAVGKGQKTAILPHSDDKKVVWVDLVRMFQRNQTTKYEQLIRCLIHTDGFYSWQWMNDAAEYMSYRPHIVQLLEEAHKSGLKTFRIRESKMYLVDLEKLTQVNLETGYSRPVAREELKSSLVPAPVLKYLADKESEKGQSTDPATK